MSKKVSNRFLPVYIFVVLVALILTQAIQWLFYHYIMQDKPQLSPFIHWAVGATALALILLSLFTNYRMVKNQLYKLN
jgi:hypothetical protein